MKHREALVLLLPLLLATNAAAQEICNHLDDDGDGAVDEGFPKAVSGERHADVYPGAGDLFGWSMASVGDVNGDGIPEIAVGSPYDDYRGWDAGLE